MFEGLDSWYETHKRILPMRREDVSTWGTLVFEVMSQQTPIARVQPIWEEWIRKWPTPNALAQSSPDEVLISWDHLGYPSRALRLHRCAQVICDQFHGFVPSSVHDLLSLPGIGPYTASAIASFCFNERVAVLDTNVRRVLTRIRAGQEFPPSSVATEKERQVATDLLPLDGSDAAIRNVALMELGSLICKARSPLCSECPLAIQCSWFRAGNPPAIVRPKGQSWKGTDRQARGQVMAILRRNYKHNGHTLSPCPALPWNEAIKAATLPQAPPEQAERVLNGLLKDGLITYAASSSRTCEDRFIRLPTADD